MRSVVRANIGLGCAVDRLNTLLELKLENERLQQHISTLRAHSQQLSATHATQHMGSYTGDDLSAQLAANLGLPTRSTIDGGDSSRSHYSLPHGYESGGGFPAISSLEDEGDAEPRRKKVRPLNDLTSVACFPDTSSCSQLKKSVGGGEQYICNTCGRTDSPEWRKVNPSYSFLDHLLTSPGCRALAVQKRFAMHVAFDGQRRCANSRRRPKQVTRITFRSTTQYLLSLVAIRLPSCTCGIGHLLTHDTRYLPNTRIHPSFISPLLPLVMGPVTRGLCGKHGY
jgi:hypothetical protein